MKKLFLVFFFLNFVCLNSVFADEGTVLLNFSSVNSLKVPQSQVDMLKKANARDDDYDADIEYFESDEDVFENKAGKVFSKFINDKAVNNKLNNFVTNVEY